MRVLTTTAVNDGGGSSGAALKAAQPFDMNRSDYVENAAPNSLQAAAAQVAYRDATRFAAIANKTQNSTMVTRSNNASIRVPNLGSQVQSSAPAMGNGPGSLPSGVDPSSPAVDVGSASVACAADRVLNEYVEGYGNAYGILINDVAIAISFVCKIAEKGIAATVRPANIGAGIFAKQKAAELAKYGKIGKVSSKVLNWLAYGAIAIDVGVGVYENIKNSEPLQHIISDAAVDAAVTGVSVIGASFFAGLSTGPVGAALGLAFGVGFYVLFDASDYNGKSIREWAKEYAGQAVDDIINAFNHAVAEGGAQ